MTVGFLPDSVLGPLLSALIIAIVYIAVAVSKLRERTARLEQRLDDWNQHTERIARHE